MSNPTGSLFLLYTLEEGGRFYPMQTTIDEFEKIKRTGEIEVFNPWEPERPAIIKPKFIMLMSELDNHDFTLGRKR